MDQQTANKRATLASAQVYLELLEKAIERADLGSDGDEIQDKLGEIGYVLARRIYLDGHADLLPEKVLQELAELFSTPVAAQGENSGGSSDR